MFFRLTLLACIFLLAVTVYGQRTPNPAAFSLQINGQVRYAQGGRPAEFVLVRLENFSGGFVGESNTDRNGKFSFTGLSGDLFILSVRVMGFKEVQQQVDLRTQLTDYVQLQLVPEPNAVDSTSKPSGVIDANIPSRAQAEFVKGRDAIAQNRNSQAGTTHLQNAVKIYPKYVAALLLLGTVHMDRQEWGQAELALRQALAVDPKVPAAHFALGELCLNQKKYSEAESELIAGLKLDPKSTRGHLSLGRVYYELGEITKAGPQVGTALQLDPKLARGHLLAGNIYLRVRQPDNALIEFQEYLRLEPNGEYSAQATQTVRRIKEALRKP